MIVNDISGDIDSLNIIKINKMIFSIKVITPLYESKNNNIDAYIYPNPFIQKINIELNLQENQDINLSLYSIQGVKIIEKKIQGTTGANHIYFNTNKINIGNYILYVNEKPYKIIKL